MYRAMWGAKIEGGIKSITFCYRFGKVKISPKFVAHILMDELIFS
jgi:hypothetical protein